MPPKNDIDSHRIRRFRRLLISKIPRFPNNKATLSQLEEFDLTKLINTYLNWVARLVPPRPRDVHVESSVINSPLWENLSNDTNNLFEKIKQGDDLSPHLSQKIQREGYTPKKNATSSWDDKDYLLNVMGYHHFHLSHKILPSGYYTERTKQVLFAEITRTTFIAIGFFDHSVFHKCSSSKQMGLSLEQQRLWQIFQDRVFRNSKNGEAYFLTSIASSGDRIEHVERAIDIAQYINRIDKDLDDLSFLSEMFPHYEYSMIKKLKPEWWFDYQDFGLFFEQTNNFHCYDHSSI